MDQFLTMAFAPLTCHESLRDIEVNLRAQAERQYHMGLRCKTASRNAMSNANATRPWQIHTGFVQYRIAMTRPSYAKDHLAIDLGATVYAFEATTINLCLSIYPWAPFQAQKAAIRMHTLLDLSGTIPTFIHNSDGKTHEVNTLDLLHLEPRAYYLLDRGHVVFLRLFVIHQANALFVTRAKSNISFKRRYSNPADRVNSNIVCDQTGVLTVFYSSKDCPATLRLVVINHKTGKRINLIPSNFALKQELIHDLYRQQAELLF